MRELVVICGKDIIRCEEILNQLVEKNHNIDVIQRVTTNQVASNSYRVVTCNEFWDMAEAGRYLEYHVSNDCCYATLHIDIHNQTPKDSYMINEIDVATMIKGIYPKAITIYILPKDCEENFKATARNRQSSYDKVRKIDFLVLDSNLDATVEKVEEIVDFMHKNGMRSNYD